MTSALSPLDTRSLVDLRALLDTARQFARTTAPAARLTAVVLLDAACERALHLVATSLPGVAVSSRTTFDDLHSKVKSELGVKWKCGAWSDVRKLHRARNSAQHEGVSPDAASLPGWITATESYAKSLIDAVFGVDLEQVLLADSIKLGELRNLISEAENHIRALDPTASLEYVVRAFDVASDEWYRQHEQVHPRSRSMAPGMHDVTGPLEEFIRSTRRSAAMQAFSVNPGEYTWFVDIKRAKRETVTIDEARRALGFVFWWIVRWEAVAADFVPDRFERWAKDQRGTRERVDSEGARISGGQVLGHRGRYVVELNLAGLPPEDKFSEWCEAVQEWLRRDSGETIEHSRVDTLGTIHIRMKNDTDMQELVAHVEDALNKAESQVVAQQVARAERAADMAAEVAKFEAAAGSSHARLPAWISQVRLDPERGQPLILELGRSAKSETFAIADVIRSHPAIAVCLWTDDGTLRISPRMPFEDAATMLQEVDAQICRIVKTRADSDAKEENEVKALNRQLSMALGGLHDRPTGS